MVMTSPVSGGYGLDGLSPEKLMRCISQDVLPQRQPDRENTKGRRVEAGCVNNKTQKWAVNPLTRHASRSVMRLDYHRRKLRGLLRYRIHHLTENGMANARPGCRFSARDQRVGPTM